MLRAAPLRTRGLLARVQTDRGSGVRSNLALVRAHGECRLTAGERCTRLVGVCTISPFTARLSRTTLRALTVVTCGRPLAQVRVSRVHNIRSTKLIRELLLENLVGRVKHSRAPKEPVVCKAASCFVGCFKLAAVSSLPGISRLFRVRSGRSFSLFSFPVSRGRSDRLTFFGTSSIVPRRR